MRKLFSILAVALFALSAHATVVTQNLEGTFSAINGSKTTLNGSSFTVSSGGWDGIQNWSWTTPQAGFNTLVLQVADHSYPINVEVFHGESLSFTKTMSATQNSLSIDITGLGKIKGLKVISATDQDATITINSSELIKVLGKETTADIWSGPYDFGNWNNGFYIDGVVDAYEGDEIIVSYTKSSEPQCQIKERNANGYLSFVGEYMDVTDDSQTSFLLNAADAEKVRTSGLFFNGKNMTITKVQLRHHNTLWTGEQKTIGNWSGNIEIPSSKLSDLQIGNIICVRVTAFGSTDGPRVSLFSGWSKSDALVGGEYYFQNTDAASAENPFIVQFPVTGSMKQQLGSKNLLVRGVNYTVTDVYVEEGTPVVESGVKGYLTVSAAGMATFMLPFNVRDLPDGVQAYNLTNDGSKEIVATEVNALEADKPVLIIAAAGEYKFISEEGASADISGKTGTYANGALIGTYTTIDQLEQLTSGAYNYILQNGSEGVGFYQVRDNTCSVAPYRAYLSCGYNATPSPGAPARAMRIVFRENTATGMENIESATFGGSQKFLRNGQLFILRNGVEYNANGALVK